MTSRGLLLWMRDHVVAGTREVVGFEDLLHDKERDGLLTREQGERMRGIATSIPKIAVTGATGLAKVVLHEMMSGFSMVGG